MKVLGGVSALLGCALLTVSSAMASPMTAAVNELRQRAGLPPLQHAPLLSEAAKRHAAYLDRHRDPAQRMAAPSAHRQQPGRVGFSGEGPPDRALAAGYAHREVLENVSMGYDGLGAALDGLMSAIYHRLTFLDLVADEMGAARGEQSRVFLLGRSDLHGLCAAPPDDALMRQPVDCMGQVMTRDAYERLCAALPAAALHRSPHPTRCPNGQLLDADYMRQLCARPPSAALFRGVGEYYQPCGRDGPRLGADWFDALCASSSRAHYRGSGRYVELCAGPQRVREEWFASFCEALPSADRYMDSGRYRMPCAAPHEVRQEFLEAAQDQVLASRPEWVLWPPDGADDVPPAFFLEEPDPLPDLEVSGNPVSLQFNPALVEQVTLNGFELYRTDGEGEYPVETRLMRADTDPNRLLTDHEFALFPLERLAWGARYRVEADVRLDDRPLKLAWQFTTRVAGAPLVEVTGRRSQWVFEPGVPFWVYVPPTRDQAHTVLSSRATFPRGSQVNVSVIDPNTAEILIETRSCDAVTVELGSVATVDLLPAGCGYRP
jgi:hypothetical protein